MKIQSVQAFLVPHKTGPGHYVYVKVQADEGLHGWGEAFSHIERAEVVERHIHRMARHLIGRDPHQVKHLREVMWLDYGGHRGGFDLYSAISGIEIACWDIIGKAAQQPIYNLIGGACRPRIRVHAYGWGGGGADSDEQSQRAKETLARGFFTLKVSPFSGPCRTLVPLEDEDQSVENIRNLRKAVGPKVQLIIEAHRRFAPMIGIRFARKVEQYGPFLYFEEPTTPENLDALADVRSRVNIPICAGEDLYTPFTFRQALEKRAADVLNPDVTCAGGILGLKEISAMAEPYGVSIAPHQYNFAIGFVASLHVAAAIPNYLTTDCMVSNYESSDEIFVKPIPKPSDGYVELPAGPGLGVDLDEKALRDRPFREAGTVSGRRGVRTYAEERY